MNFASNEILVLVYLFDYLHTLVDLFTEGIIFVKPLLNSTETFEIIYIRIFSSD